MDRAPPPIEAFEKGSCHDLAACDTPRCAREEDYLRLPIDHTKNEVSRMIVEVPPRSRSDRQTIDDLEQSFTLVYWELPCTAVQWKWTERSISLSLANT